MGIRIEKKLVVFETVSMAAIEPSGIFTKKEEVLEYIKEHPFPETEFYGTQDLIGDTQSGEMWTLMEEVTEEQQNYIEDMVAYFL